MTFSDARVSRLIAEPGDQRQRKPDLTAVLGNPDRSGTTPMMTAGAPLTVIERPRTPGRAP